MKILSIGNSFSQDAHAHLHELAAQNGIDLYTVNLYIGGCSLHTHWNHVVDAAPAYDLEINGCGTGKHISIPDALAMEDWDVITLQQVSHLSGMPASYFPWFGQLYDYVRKERPKARIYFHRTWAYAADSNHSYYGLYNHDQKLMLHCIELCAQMVDKIWALPVIPTGPVIERLRPQLGDARIHRDKFHLSLDYGRLAAAATWFKTLTGQPIKIQPYRDLDPSLIERIYQEVNAL